MELNKYFFNALRGRLENILRPLSLNYQAKILWGENTATDVVNTVYVRPTSTIVDGVKNSLAELLIAYKAQVAHEGGHIRFTSLKAWEEAISKGAIFQHLTNIIEDGRIEALIAEELPGAGRWLKFQNEFIFKNRTPGKYGKGIQAFMMGLTMYSVCGKIPNLDQEIITAIKKAAPYVDIGKAASSTENVLVQAQEILNLPEVQALIPPSPQLEIVPLKGSSNPQEQSAQNAQDRAKQAEVLIVARGKSKKKEEKNEEEEEKSEEDNKRDSIPETTQEDAEPTSEQPIEDTSNSEEVEENSENSEEEPQVKDFAEEKKENNTETTSLKNNSSDNTNQETNEEASSTTEEGEADPTIEKLEKDFFSKENSEETEESFEELLENISEELSTILKDMEKLEEEEKEINPTEGIVENIKLSIIELSPDPTLYQEVVKANALQIQNLTNEIQTALEAKKAYDLRNQNRGRLSSSSLWKLAVNDPAVFSKRIIPGDIPELAASILIDCSGSMSGYPLATAIDTGAIISETMRNLKIKHCITGFEHFEWHTRHHRAVDWDDTTSDKLTSLCVGSYNRDGFSIRVATNEILQRPEPRKVLFVLSDGRPNSCEKEGYKKVGVEDTRRAVLEAKKKGIQVISLFFGSEELISNFLYMYDTPVFVEEINLLPRTLGEVFKRVLLNY